MSSPVNVTIIAEGASEQNFVDRVLASYLAARGVYLHATQISKKGFPCVAFAAGRIGGRVDLRLFGYE